MYKRLFTALILLCFFVSHSCAIDVSAKSAILYEPETKTVLFEKDSKTERPIASTTKILTALVALQHADLSETVTVPRAVVGTEGTSMYLKENEKLSVSDLLYGLLLRSGNDAASALAYHIGKGDTGRFTEMMNRTARDIGMKNSCFKNPSGLPEEGHFSTAYDMALLASRALENPLFSEIVATKEKTVAGRLLSNHNKMLRLYEGANGVKTGFTKAAGRCLVSSAERNGMTLVAVTLSAPDDWDDHTEMLDYGFDNFALKKYSSENIELPELPVAGGTLDGVSVNVCGELSFLTEKSKENGVKAEIILPRFVYAPITSGDVVGEIRYVLNGENLGSLSVVSCDTVTEYKSKSFIRKILDFFGRK